MQISKEMRLKYHGVKDACKRMRDEDASELPVRKKGSGRRPYTDVQERYRQIGVAINDNSEQSINSLAMQHGVSRSGLQKYIRDVLQLKALKKAKARALTE